MDTPDNRLSELVDLAKSWIPPRAELVKLPRDFWMPDHSCRVCYECDSQFNVFNRKHHCRLCGRVFCAQCTSNSIPALSDEQNSGREDWEIIRVCNYCLKQWEQRTVTADNGGNDPVPALSPSLSAVSLVSTKSFSTYNSGSGSSSVGPIPPSTKPYQHVPYRNDLSPHGSPAQIDLIAFEQQNVAPEREPSRGDSRDQSSYQSDDEDDYYYGLYHSDSESRHYGCVDDMEQFYGPFQVHHGNHTDSCNVTSTSHETYDMHEITGNKEGGDKVDADPGFGGTSLDSDSVNAEPVDFENNRLLWLPPEPEDEEDEKEVVLFDDDDGDGATGEWGYLYSSNSFGRGEFQNKERGGEDQRKAMKNAVEGHFRALIAQFLQVENLPVDGEDGKESWLEIISSLCWEAASLLKPDTSKGGGMDPGGYVKVKCIACGWRGERMPLFAPA